MTQPTPADAAHQFREAQVKEYGQYVAAQDIHVGHALAYRKGDPVPASNVAAHGYDKTDPPLVAKVGTKAAAEVAPSTTDTDAATAKKGDR